MSDYAKEIDTEKNQPPGKIFGSETISLSGLFEKFNIEQCEIVKSDIEWSEYEAFTELLEGTMAAIKRITMEFHGVAKPEIWGSMIANLSKKFIVETTGDYAKGGYIRARRY
jgi:hypothetical protein